MPGTVVTAEEAARLQAELPWADDREAVALINEPVALTINVPVDVLERFRAQPGTDDLDKLCGLLAQAA